MASLRDIRGRIGSVKNIRQITSAMKMVAIAKMRRATDAATSARPYQQTLGKTLQRVAARAGDAGAENPLLAQRDQVKKVALIIVTSDRGLCGGFNSTLNRRTEEWIRQARSEGKEVAIYTYGRKARDYFKNRGYAIAEVRTEIVPAKYNAEVNTLADWLTASFQNGAFDQAWLAYNQFKSTLTQIPTFNQVLPLAINADEAGAGSAGSAPGAGSARSADYIYEPGSAAILGTLLPLYLRTLLLQALLETDAGFYASQMRAMDSATRNATDMIGALTLEYNRSRQAAITKELIEIISGAEAV